MKDHKKDHAPCLTVCIACKGIPSVLKENLMALEKQTLNKSQWKVILLVPQKKQLSFVEQVLNSFSFQIEISSCFYKNSLQELRNRMLDHVKTPFLLFIDEDVILKNSDHLKNLLHLHDLYSEVSVLGGGYLSGEGCSFWGRVYNWISRLWMLKNPGFSPAGNLSVKMNLLELKCRFKSPLPDGFGGEEIYFFNQVHNSEKKYIWEKKLDTFHKASHTFNVFFKRAIIHGQSQSVFPYEGNFYDSAFLFIKQPGSLSIKTAALFYLILVTVVSVFYRLKRFFYFQKSLF